MAIEIVGIRAPRPRRPLESAAAVEETGDGSWTTSWPAWGTTAYVTVTDPGLLPAARRIAAKEIAAAEKAAARHRPDAEIHRLYRAGGRPISVSPRLAELVAAALLAAERSGGDVDPTVAAAVTRANAAHRDLSAVPVCGSRTASHPAPGYEAVDLQGRRLRVPAGVTLDLSATAKAVTGDHAASLIQARLGVGVLVGLGANVASAGPAPAAGWTVTIAEPGAPEHTRVRIPAGAALASRSARTADGLIDPRTGRAPQPVWRSATAIGFTAVEAATYTAAALVRGAAARGWLSQLWVPARLVTVHGDVIDVGPWLAHETIANPRRTILR